MKKLSSIIALVIISSIIAAQAEIKLPSYVTDNMVMQQNSLFNLKGTVEAGIPVSVTPSWPGAKTIKANADANGEFVVQLRVPSAGGPYNVTVKAGDETRLIDNILLGEVWFCSGQSNMQMPVMRQDHVMDYESVIAQSQYPAIRLLQIRNVYSTTPLKDAVINNVEWTISSPASMPEFSAVAYFAAREMQECMGVPVGIIDCSWGGTPAQSWIPLDWLSKMSDFDGHVNAINSHLQNGTELPEAENPCFPTVLYNAMVAPLTEMPVKGFFWYQGCANVGYPELYGRMMKTLVNAWREKWGGEEKPFYFVQLAGYLAPVICQPESEWAALRQAQCAVLELPNTGYVTAVDLGHPGDIHPKNKTAVGVRLANLAMDKTYGIEGIDSHMATPKDVQFKGNEAVIEFDAPLVQSKFITGFIVGDKDGKFYTASAEVIDSHKAKIRGNGVAKIVSVRYNWADYPQGSLYGLNGLPVAPFATTM